MMMTVAIPTFNRKALLGEALESVFLQDFSDYQVLISDDGSTDGTASYLRSVGNSRVRAVFQEKNLGGVGNWRYLLGAAETEYVALLEDDNLWEKSHLRRAAEALEKESGAAYYGAKTVSFGKEEQETYQPYWLTESTGMTRVTEKEAACKVGRFIPVSVNSVVLRKDRLDGLAWPTGNHLTWDWLLLGQLSLKGGFIYDAEVGARYRWHAGNWCHNSVSGRSKQLLETRETVRTVMNVAFAKGVLTAEELVREVQAWDVWHVATFLRTLSGGDLHPSLERALREVFGVRRRELMSMKSNRQVRMAACTSYEWLELAARLDGVLGRFGK